MGLKISSESLNSASTTIQQIANGMSSDLSEPGRCYNLGPTVNTAVIRMPGIFNAIKVRVDDHVGGYATLLKEAATDADRVDRRVAGG